MIKLNIRKLNQTISYSFPKGITVVYKDRNGVHEEFFSNQDVDRLRKGDYSLNDIEVLKNIYKNFNKTLKPGEPARHIAAFFHTYEATTFTKIKV